MIYGFNDLHDYLTVVDLLAKLQASREQGQCARRLCPDALCMPGI